MAKKEELFSRKKRQSGVALLIALFVLLLLSAIGLGMMYATNTETSINANYKDKQMAVYASLSGIHEARERIVPAHCPPPSYTVDSLYPWAICAPTTAPPSTAPTGSEPKPTVLYIINPSNGETVDPTDTSNLYFDTELCHENILGLVSPGNGAPCDPTTTPKTNVIPATNKWVDVTSHDDSKSSAGPFQLSLPLNTKWTRIVRKSNNMGIVPADGNAGNSTVLCWDGKQQVPLPTGYDPITCGPPHQVQSIKFLTTPNPPNPPTSTCMIGSPAVATPCSANWNVVPNVVIDPSPTGNSGDNATASVVLASGTPAGSVGIVLDTHGAGYTAQPDVVFTGGGGSGAAAIANMAFGSPITSLKNVNLGTQCYPTASATFSGSGFSGGGAGAKWIATVGTSQNCISQLTVDANCDKNVTATVSVTGAGSGFAIDPNYSIVTGGTSGNFTGAHVSISNPGTGKGGTLTVKVYDTTNSKYCTGVNYSVAYGYNLSSIVIDTANEGAAYTGTPHAVVTGAGAVGDISLEGSVDGNLGTAVSQVVSLTQSSGGSGYVTAPTVSFACNTHPGCWSAGGSNAQATAHTTLSPTYSVTGFSITNAGAGYSDPPHVSFQCPGGGSGCGGDGVQLQAILTGTANLTYGVVYQLTSLGVTTTGARAMTQAEVVTNVRGMAVSGALTLDGPAPNITKFSSSDKFYVSGDPSSIPAGDVSCPGTHSLVPAIGAYDDPNNPTTPTAVQDVVSNIPSGRTSNYYGSGPSPDVQNVYGSLGDTLGTTTGLQSLAQDVWQQATYNGTTYGTGEALAIPSGSANVALGDPSNYVVDYVNGDVQLSGTNDGYGTLFVTGTLTFNGNFTWHGMVFVVGTGNIQFKGGGNGSVDGSVIVANICSGAGPCSMPHGLVTSPNTLLSAQGTPTYGYAGGGTNNIQYNPCAIDTAMAGFYVRVRPQSTPLRVISTRTVTY